MGRPGVHCAGRDTEMGRRAGEGIGDMGSDGIYQLMHTVLSFQRLAGLVVVGWFTYNLQRILDICF